MKKSMENATALAFNPLPSAAAHRVERQHHQEDDGGEFTCEICIEKTSFPNKKFRNGDKCVHPFCTNCVIKYIRVRLGEHNTGHIKCPATDCDHMLDPLACAPLIGRFLFLWWCDVLCESAITGWETRYCPYKDCNVRVLNECGGELSRSRCPQCKRLFCFRCKTVSHGPLTCKENRDAEPLRKLAALKRWQTCPSCGEYVELASGCSIVRCRCRITFCHKCGKQVHRHYCPCENVQAIGIRTRILVILVVYVLLAPFFILFYIHERRKYH
ncbi:E3 ubiquitin-protein ligase RSL1-like [Primulina eburnea]|uniref:E3 ubiquitin-protein ligase RSL1-like n=1 Tax=Primulina eburnea TaxID=1245227 RepID=UPI003C6C9BCD